MSMHADAKRRIEDALYKLTPEQREGLDPSAARNILTDLWPAIEMELALAQRSAGYAITKHRIYVASSWRNQYQPAIVCLLLADGHEVYDFRNPSGAEHGFSWRECESGKPWQDWTPAEYIQALQAPPAERGFTLDMNALQWCDTCVLVLPCGRSAHLELGWAAGAGKRTAVLVQEAQQTEALLRAEQNMRSICMTLGPGALRGWEPELMYKMCGLVTESTEELVAWIAGGAS